MVEVRQARSGEPTAILNGRYLHSQRNPRAEAERAVADLARRDPPCVVMLGFGLGYHAEALLGRTESAHIVVFEPDEELARQLRTAREVSGLLASPRMSWCSSLERLDEEMVLRGSSGFEVFTLVARKQADPEVFSRAEAILNSLRSRLDINSNTLTRFGKLWIRNLCRNVPALASGVTVTRLEGMFESTPGLLLAAGPGLEQILKYLPELAQRMLVVAVDTAVAAAQDAGVEPDIAVVVDPQYWNARHLDRVFPSHTLLLAESSTHPSVFGRFRSPPLFCSSLFPLGREMENAVGAMGSLGTGGSVSTTAWDLLRLAGCSEIYVAGLDLGFPGGRTHYRGSFFEQLAVALANRFAPAERTLYRYVASARPRMVEATDGSLVRTDVRMELYHRWFARQVASDAAPRTFTLSSGGVRIDGIELRHFEEVRVLPIIRDEIGRRLSSVQPLSPQDVSARRVTLRERLSTLLEGLESLRATVDRALDLILEIRNRAQSGEIPDFGPLAEVDSEITEAKERGIVSFLMQEAIGRIQSGYGSASVDEQIEASLKLYEGLRESVLFHANVISRTLSVDAWPAE